MKSKYTLLKNLGIYTLYWMFDSENKDLNELIEYQLDYLGKKKHMFEFFKRVNNNEN